MKEKEAVQAFLAARDIPYSIPLAVKDEDYCCSGKHRLLKNRLDQLGYSTRYRVCAFRWKEMGLPTRLYRVPHEDVSTHVFLEFYRNGKWLPVDATWDEGITSVLPANTWDGISGTPVAVPVTEYFNPEESERIMSEETDRSIIDDLKKNGLFYKALNEWMDGIRQERLSGGKD